MDKQPKREKTGRRQAERRSRRPTAVGSSSVQAYLPGLVQLPHGTITATGDDALQAQANRLDDARVQSVQQQTLIAQIGRVQGNRHLLGVVAATRLAVKQSMKPGTIARGWPEDAPESTRPTMGRPMGREARIALGQEHLRHPVPPLRLGGETREDMARSVAAWTHMIEDLVEDLAERDQSIYGSVVRTAQTLITTSNLRMGLMALTESDETAQGIASDIVADQMELLAAVDDAEAREHRRHAREIADQIERECIRMAAQRQQLLQQMHRAFRTSNTNLIEQMTGAYGRINGLLEEAATCYDVLREWNGRSDLDINGLTRFLSKAISVVNFFSSLGHEIPGLASSTEEALGLLTRAYNTAGTVTTLLNVSPTMYGLLTTHIGPALSAISSNWSTIENHLRERNDVWYATYGAEAVDWNREPGGRAVFDYLVSVFRASAPGELPPIPADVGQFFMDQRALLNAAMRALGIEEMPTERSWILRQRLSREQFKEWIFHNRELVWRLIYGTTRPLPTR